MIRQIAKELKNYSGNVLVLTHHNADIDAIASSIGMFHCLKELGLKVDIGVSESVSRTAKRISKDYDVKTNPDCRKYDKIILVETSVPEQLKGVKNLKVDMIIDHHLPGKLADVEVKWIDPSFKSTTQMIYLILRELDVPVDKNLARLLAAGIIADTKYLRIADVSSLETIIELMKKGITIEDSMGMIAMKPDISEVVACLRAAKRLEMYRVGDLILVFSKVASHEAAAARSLVRIGSDIAVVAAIKEKELRISSRGNSKILGYNIDLSEIFKEVGEAIDGSGGGHDLAGSANGKNIKAADNAFRLILKQISEKTCKKVKKL